jgi:hypothetical protein
MLHPPPILIGLIKVFGAHEKIDEEIKEKD